MITKAAGSNSPAPGTLAAINVALTLEAVAAATMPRVHPCDERALVATEIRPCRRKRGDSRPHDEDEDHRHRHRWVRDLTHQGRRHQSRDGDIASSGLSMVVTRTT